VATNSEATNAGSTWEIRGPDELVLVANPSRFQEARYHGATMKRIGELPPDSRSGNPGSTPVVPAGACRVTGQIRSSEYEKLGGSIERTIVTATQQQGKKQAGSATSQGGRFEINLAPGEYQVRFAAFGSRGATFMHVTRPVTVQVGQKDLDLGVIDL